MLTGRAVDSTPASATSCSTLSRRAAGEGLTVHEFRVWAPGGRPAAWRCRPAAPPLPMTPDGGGWWTLTLPDAGHGTDYGFVLDDGEPRCPTRARAWQPTACTASARSYDHDRFTWNDARLDRPAAARQRHLRAARRHVHRRRARSTPRSSSSTTCVDLGVDLVELLPRRRVPRRARTGATTASAGTRCTSPTAAPTG